MQMRSNRITVGVAGLLLAGACVPEGAEFSTFVEDDIEETAAIAALFHAAAEESGVPPDVLIAVVELETGFVRSTGEVEFEGQSPVFGLFGLGGERLERAADLIGADPNAVMIDDATNIRAGAALLAEEARAAGLTDEQMYDATAWGPALARYVQVDADVADAYVDQVMALVREGVAIPLDDGTTIVVRGAGETPTEFDTTASGLSAPNTRWLPSPNHSSRSGADVRFVVIHTCEGSYSSCVSWLRQSRAQASAHYVVREDGKQVAQLVDENRKAWHIAANYRPHLNGGRMSGLAGRSMNSMSIGIEHGGRASQSRWPTAQIDRSVSLVRSITARHNIPRDRYHIVGHGQLQPENRSDPGRNWPWSSYLRRIQGTTSVRVDNSTSGRFQASGSWGFSHWASGRVGRNYRYRSPNSTKDNARYKVKLPSTGQWQVYARVPGNGYNTGIRYVLHTADGRKVVRRDVKNRGASWVSLGTHRFAAGDAWRVEVASQTSGRGYIIADAVKFVKR